MSILSPHPPHSPRDSAVTTDSELAGKVLLFAGDNDTACALTDYADGIVFHGSAGMRAAASCDDTVVRLIDRELYKYDRYRSSQPQLIPETDAEGIEAQLGAGAWALLAPARFPRDRSASQISATIAAGAGFVAAAHTIAPMTPTFVPIVIRFDELADGRWIQPIRDSELPVAPIFAGFGDPLGDPAAVTGAIELCQVARVALQSAVTSQPLVSSPTEPQAEQSVSAQVSGIFGCPVGAAPRRRRRSSCRSWRTGQNSGSSLRPWQTPILTTSSRVHARCVVQTGTFGISSGPKARPNLSSATASQRRWSWCAASCMPQTQSDDGDRSVSTLASPIASLRASGSVGRAHRHRSRRGWKPWAVSGQGLAARGR